MPKQQFLPTSTLKLKYSLQDSSVRWFISFHQINPASGKKYRHRMSFGMNKIKDLRRRYEFATEKVQHLKNLLPLGYPYTIDPEIPAPSESNSLATFPNSEIKSYEKMTLEAGIQRALKIKLNTDRHKSRNVYRNISGIFLRYAQDKIVSFDPLRSFNRTEAMAFLDYVLLDRGVSARTWNNYLTVMRSFFSELVSRGYIKNNPFSGIREKKVTEKQRRALTPFEQKIISAEIYQKDKTLMLAVLLIYHCFIRPTELRRLRFKHFDLQRSIINMPGSITKNRDAAIVTIPDILIDYMIKFGFHKYHSNLLIFGKKGLPHHHVPIGEHTLNRRHREILISLNKKNILQDIEGLSLYSWKDTGALEMLNAGIGIMDLKNQIRHKNLSDTQLYLTALSNVNDKIKKLQYSILPK